MKSKNTKKRITNEEFNLAYAQPENRSVINWYTNKFARNLPQDEAEACGIRGLWQALSIFNKSKGYKLVSLLGKCVANECRRINKEHNKFTYKHRSVALENLPYKTCDTDNIELVNTLLDSVSEQEQKIIRMKYYEGKTYQEIGNLYNLTKQRIQQIVTEAFSKISKEHCERFVVYNNRG